MVDIAARSTQQTKKSGEGGGNVFSIFSKHLHFWKKKEAQVHRRAGKRSIKDSSDYFHPKFTRKEKRPR